MLRFIISVACSCLFLCSFAQFQLNWNKDGNSYTTIENGSIVQVELPSLKKTIQVGAVKFTPERNDKPLRFTDYQFSGDRQKVLQFTDPHRGYHNTFSNCWVYDVKTGQLFPVAKGFKPSYLLNTKFSPYGTKVAFVYDNNIYAEDLSTQKPIQLTKDGNERKLNG